jgi:hypothetical protein
MERSDAGQVVLPMTAMLIRGVWWLVQYGSCDDGP